MPNVLLEKSLCCGQDIGDETVRGPVPNVRVNRIQGVALNIEYESSSRNIIDCRQDAGTIRPWRESTPCNMRAIRAIRKWWMRNTQSSSCVRKTPFWHSHNIFGNIPWACYISNVCPPISHFTFPLQGNTPWSYIRRQAKRGLASSSLIWISPTGLWHNMFRVRIPHEMHVIYKHWDWGYLSGGWKQQWGLWKVSPKWVSNTHIHLGSNNS